MTSQAGFGAQTSACGLRIPHAVGGVKWRTRYLRTERIGGGEVVEEGRGDDAHAGVIAVGVVDIALDPDAEDVARGEQTSRIDATVASDEVGDEEVVSQTLERVTGDS